MRMWNLNTVISAIKLFLLFSLGVPFLLGLGWLAVGPILHGSLTIKKKDIPLLQEIPLMLMSGLIINYGIILCMQSLKMSLIAGCIISIFGILCFSLYLFHYHLRQMPKLASVNKWIGLFIVCLLFLTPILALPLEAWDARSIWFFHAKMIYVASSIGQSAGWQDPSIVFSHTDYPTLVPALAAQGAYVMGYWNEYIPKISLFFMLIPGVTWLFTFARRSFSFIFLLFLVLFNNYPFIWNGYMDGFLALYFSIALLLLGRYIKSSQPIDMVSSICCLITLTYLKNEGVLAAIAGFCPIILIYFFKKKSLSIKNVFLKNWKYFTVSLLSLLPFLLWSFYKRQWNLSNDLEIGTMQSFMRMIGRLSDGSYIIILQNAYQQIEGALLLLGLLYFVSFSRIKSLLKESLPALIAAGIYCLGMMIVYFITPYDLAWHLSSSIGRTMFSVNGCIFIDRKSVV
jgi:hypothetical protein